MIELLVVAGIAVVAIIAVCFLCLLHYWHLHLVLNRQFNHVSRVTQANLALAERPHANLLASKQEDTEQQRVHNEGEAVTAAAAGRVTPMSPSMRARNFAAG